MVEIINKEKLKDVQLPGIVAHRRIFPDEARYDIPQNCKHSAVLACIFSAAPEPSLLLIKRSPQGKHGGQIAFPGGQKETIDKNLMETAIRECREEVGLDQVKILRELSSVYIPVSNFLMQTYLSRSDQDISTLRMNYEVAEILFMPLHEIPKLKIEKVKIHTLGVERSVNAFRYENKIIWGATSMVLSEIQILLNKINP